MGALNKQCALYLYGLRPFLAEGEKGGQARNAHTNIFIKDDEG